MISAADNNFAVLTTDIAGSRNGSGAIVNVNGEVIGLMLQGYGSTADQSTLTALAISDVKAIIEKLANNQDISYIGLELTTVTNDIAREYGIPKGAYIKDVKMDSPAMAAGLQTGDVVTSVGGDTVLSVEAYERILLSLAQGKSVEIVVQRQGVDDYTEITCTVEVGVLR